MLLSWRLISFTHRYHLIAGQHLITAEFEREFNFPTKSWSLGVDISYIELDFAAELTQDKINHVEQICNQSIADATPVRVDVISDQLADDIPIEVRIF